MSWIIGRSAGSTQPSLGRVSLSLHSYQNPQFGMTINNIPLLEIKDFGPPARGGHFVLFHSFLPPQPFGTQFHTAHSSPVQLVSLTLPHVGGREFINYLAFFLFIIWNINRLFRLVIHHLNSKFCSEQVFYGITLNFVHHVIKHVVSFFFIFNQWIFLSISS